MSISKKLMTAGGGPKDTYVDDVFSTYVYDGNATARSIVNGIDLDGEGGLVWTKERSDAANHYLYDTERGALNRLFSNSTGSASDIANSLTAFNNDGFSLGTGGSSNANGEEYVSWAFRKAKKFFDVVTYTGDGVFGREVPHNLGAEAGFVVVKPINQNSDWICWHKDLGTEANGYVENIILNEPSLRVNYGMINRGNRGTDWSKNIWLASNSEVNGSGEEYIAYVFAHDESDESMIKCGSYSGNGNNDGPEIDLGFEPQWVMVKAATGTARGWAMFDVTRGMHAGGYTDAILYANESNQEATDAWVSPTANGFKFKTNDQTVNGSSAEYIYMAIRRPNKPAEEFEPEELFAVDNYTGNGTTNKRTSDVNVSEGGLVWLKNAGATGKSHAFMDTSRGPSNYLFGDLTSAEALYPGTGVVSFDSDGFTIGGNGDVTNQNGGNYVSYALKRAPGFFDIVAYTGSTQELEVPHNLGVAPELIITKARAGTTPWNSWHKDFTNREYVNINDDGRATDSGVDLWGSNSTVATDSVFRVSSGGTGVNMGVGALHIAYLFASVPGISKVGSYTADSQRDVEVDCGFTNGARFVLIKRVDDPGNWFFYDSERGISVVNSPYLQLDNNYFQVGSNDIEPLSSGFIATSASSNVNANGAEYIFYAIA